MFILEWFCVNLTLVQGKVMQRYHWVLSHGTHRINRQSEPARIHLWKAGPSWPTWSHSMTRCPIKPMAPWLVSGIVWQPGSRSFLWTWCRWGCTLIPVFIFGPFWQERYFGAGAYPEKGKKAGEGFGKQVWCGAAEGGGKRRLWVDLIGLYNK